MSGYTVIAYRKICEADRVAVAYGHLLPKRFELHLHLTEVEARKVFDAYRTSSQVLAAELYSPDGLVDRVDLLVDLTAADASLLAYGHACYSAL